MTPGPRVSVITPAFNAVEYLEEAASSVLSQSFREFEYLIIDDGSTDGTLELAETLASKDSRVRVLKGDHGGSGAARNRGLREASGEFVAFCDGDDRWGPSFMERSVAALDDAPREVGATFTWFNRMGPEGQQWGEAQTTDLVDFDARAMLIGHCPPGNGSTLLLRRSVFDEAGIFDERMESCVDYEMWVRIGVESSTPLFRAIGEALVDWRVRPGSISSSERGRVFGLADVLGRYGHLVKESDVAQAYTWPAVLAFYAEEDEIARRWARDVRSADRWYWTRGGNSTVLGAMMLLGAPTGRRLRSSIRTLNARLRAAAVRSRGSSGR